MARNLTRSTRLEARISPAALAVVKRAAEIQGRSVSDFVIVAAQEAAQKTIAQTQIISLSLDDQRALAQAIINPPKPTPALRRAKRAHRRLLKPRGPFLSSLRRSLRIMTGQPSRAVWMRLIAISEGRPGKTCDAGSRIASLQRRSTQLPSRATTRCPQRAFLLLIFRRM